MREHGLQPRVCSRFTATADSDHNQPIFPNLARDIIPDGPDQLWVADITYVTIIGGFAYANRRPAACIILIADHKANSSGRRNTLTKEVAMNIRKRRSDRSGRAPLSSPGGPPAAV